MAVTVTTNTLSSRVRYLNVSESTANADAKDVILAMANALIALGWSRYDTAGETAVVGSDDNAGVILRRACYDETTSGHYNYLGLRLVGSGTNTYTFHLIQAADWSSTTSMTAFVSAAACAAYTPNTTGNTRFMSFAAGGTIWLFDSGKTLLITSQSGAFLTKSMENTWIVGEYKKEFGENVDAATEYIHNGVFTNDRWLLDGCGVSSSTVSQSSQLISVPGVLAPTSVMTRVAFDNTLTDYSNVSWTQGIRTGTGSGYAQFSLTEAPSVGTTPLNSVTATRTAVAPTSVQFGFTTRLLMGYLGYIGHNNDTSSNSIYAEFIGYTSGQKKDVYTIPASRTTTNPVPASSSSSATAAGWGPTLFCARGPNGYPLINTIQEYSPATLPTNLLFTVYEPTLSCGTSNGINSTLSSTVPATLTYSGPQYKFSMLGRIFDLKIFGPFTNEKYVMLDSIIMPCDADGFFAVGGTNKEFWILPSGNNIAFIMPK